MASKPNATVRLTHWCVCVCLTMGRLEEQQGIAFSPPEIARRRAVEAFVNECATLSASAIADFEPCLPVATLFERFDQHLHDADLGVPGASLHPEWLIAERLGRKIESNTVPYLMAVSEQLLKRLLAIASQWDPPTHRPCSSRPAALSEHGKRLLRALVVEGLMAPIEEQVAKLQQPLLLAITDTLSPLPRLGGNIASVRPNRPGPAVVLN